MDTIDSLVEERRRDYSSNNKNSKTPKCFDRSTYSIAISKKVPLFLSYLPRALIYSDTERPTMM